MEGEEGIIEKASTRSDSMQRLRLVLATMGDIFILDRGGLLEVLNSLGILSKSTSATVFSSFVRVHRASWAEGLSSGNHRTCSSSSLSLSTKDVRIDPPSIVENTSMD
jgi:hypothetical protein